MIMTSRVCLAFKRGRTLRTQRFIGFECAMIIHGESEPSIESLWLYVMGAAEWSVVVIWVEQNRVE